MCDHIACVLNSCARRRHRSTDSRTSQWKQAKLFAFISLDEQRVYHTDRVLYMLYILHNMHSYTERRTTGLKALWGAFRCSRRRRRRHAHAMDRKSISHANARACRVHPARAWYLDATAVACCDVDFAAVSFPFFCLVLFSPTWRAEQKYEPYLNVIYTISFV